VSSAQVSGAMNRITRWAKAHPQAKAILPSLRKPATEADIAAFEKESKLKLPPALAALYRLHDGQDEGAANEAFGEGTIESGLFPSLESGDLAFLLVPLEELASNCDSGMPGFRRGWIPFGDNYGGDNIVLDYADTTAPPRRGRVLQFNHEYGGATELAASFEQYLAQLADDLERGRIAWDEEAGLSYVQGREWDDLIEQGKVEFAEEEQEDEDE
jgi:cell wall assembly regulator SMI1